MSLLNEIVKGSSVLSAEDLGIDGTGITRKYSKSFTNEISIKSSK